MGDSPPLFIARKRAVRGKPKVTPPAECAICLERADRSSEEGRSSVAMPCCGKGPLCLRCAVQCVTRKVRQTCPLCQVDLPPAFRAEVLERAKAGAKGAREKEARALEALEALEGTCVGLGSVSGRG